MDFGVIELILDSNNFTVGGGSASAIAGGMAAGLAGMVARLSAKKPIGFSGEEYNSMADELDELAQKLVDGAKKDTEAYMLIKNAFALPKDTDDEKAIRTKAVSDAGIAAASVPRDNAVMCKRVYTLAKSLEGRSNSAAFSDLSGAIFLSEAGAKGCMLNIEANLSLIRDEAVVESFQENIKSLQNLA